MFLFVVHNTGAPIAMMEFVCLVFLSLAFSVLKESTRVLFWQELSSDAGNGCILGAFFHLFFIIFPIISPSWCLSLIWFGLIAVNLFVQPSHLIKIKCFLIIFDVCGTIAFN